MLSILKALLGSVVWNSAFAATPAGTDDAGQGDDRIVELKEALYERLEKEHTMDETSGAAAEDGWHRSGSAMLYTGTSEPTTKPDGVTALDADDTGRTFFNTDSSKLYVYVHGTGWVLAGVEEPPIGSTYMQFASRAAPADMYGGTWSNISSTYAGLFFRAEGGDAETFGGGTQAGSTYLRYLAGGYIFDTSFSQVDDLSTSASTNKAGAAIAGSISNTLYAYTIRPVNQTVRIWKRTA